MSALSSDTDPKIERMQIELIRRMPTWRKISMVDIFIRKSRPFDQMQGVLKTRAGELDLDDLHKWAVELHVGDLLERALKGSS